MAAVTAPAAAAKPRLGLEPGASVADSAGVGLRSGVPASAVPEPGTCGAPSAAGVGLAPGLRPGFNPGLAAAGLDLELATAGISPAFATAGLRPGVAPRFATAGLGLSIVPGAMVPVTGAAPPDAGTALPACSGLAGG